MVLVTLAITTVVLVPILVAVITSCVVLPTTVASKILSH